MICILVLGPKKYHANIVSILKSINQLPMADTRKVKNKQVASGWTVKTTQMGHTNYNLTQRGFQTYDAKRRYPSMCHSGGNMAQKNN